MSDNALEAEVDGLVDAVLASRKQPPAPLATGTIISIASGPDSTVTVAGMADTPVPCRTLSTFDSLYATAGQTLVGSAVVVVTIAGQPYVLAGVTSGA